MPTTGGVFTPISRIVAAGAYNQARQILRGQLGAQATGGPPPDVHHILQRIIARYIPVDQVVPADIGRLLQIIGQAQRAHTAGISLNQPGAGPGTLAGIGVDPTIETGGPRVRYRVVVGATDSEGHHSEILVMVDSDHLLTPGEVIGRAIDASKQADPMRTRGYNIEDFAQAGLTYTVTIISVGKSR